MFAAATVNEVCFLAAEGLEDPGQMIRCLGDGRQGFNPADNFLTE